MHLKLGKMLSVWDHGEDTQSISLCFLSFLLSHLLSFLKSLISFTLSFLPLPPLFLYFSITFSFTFCLSTNCLSLHPCLEHIITKNHFSTTHSMNHLSPFSLFPYRRGTMTFRPWPRSGLQDAAGDTDNLTMTIISVLLGRTCTSWLGWRCLTSRTVSSAGTTRSLTTCTRATRV